MCSNFVAPMKHRVIREPRCSGGFTLIEMIVIIVMVSIVAVALFGVFTTTIARSADPMFRMQAVAIAQGYLEEALLKAATDPDGGETNSCEEGNANIDRPDYDDVWDYNGACINDTDGARDQFGNPMPELSAYNIQMAVATINVNGITLRQVTVTVTHASQPLSIVLVGYR